MSDERYTVRLLSPPVNVVKQVLKVTELTPDNVEIFAQEFQLDASAREKVVSATVDNNLCLELHYEDANGNKSESIRHTFISRATLVQTPLGFGQITSEGYGEKPVEPAPVIIEPVAPVVTPEVTPEPAPVPEPAVEQPAEPAPSEVPQPETPAT